MASVVTNRPATEEASCSAGRTTLAGSMMPLATMSTYSSVCALKPNVSDLFSRILPTTIEPSTPAFSAIWRTGASSAFSTMLMPACTSEVSLTIRPAAFFRRTVGVEGFLDAILLFLHLDLGRTADANDRNPAGELGKTLLQLLAVVVRGGLLDLRLDLADAGFDVLFLAGAADDRGVFLVDHHLAGASQHVDRDVFELHAEFVRDQLAAGQDRDVLEHRLAAIAEAGRLDGGDLEAAAQAGDPQRGQSLAFDVFRDDQQWLAGLDHGFQHRQHRLQAGQFLLVQQHVDVLELGGHLFGIGDEIGREIAAVEFHALDDVDFGFERLVFLDGDDAFVADLLHRLGDHLADRGVAVGGDGADLRDFGGRGDRLGAFLDILDHGP